MSRTEQVELTTLCMVCRGEELLLQNRVKTDWRGYCFPGGHVEPGESIVDSVVREMKEETGLTILCPRLCGIKQFPIDGGRYLVFFFKTDSFDGELISSDEENSGELTSLLASIVRNYKGLEEKKAKPNRKSN